MAIGTTAAITGASQIASKVPGVNQAVDAVGGAIGSVGDVLGIGGGGGPDPSGTKTLGSGAVRAVLAEDRTDQNGSDPATLRVTEGGHTLQGTGFAGFTRAVKRLDPGWKLTVQDNQGQTAVYTGPISTKKDFRNRGINDSGVAAVAVERVGQSSGGQGSGAGQRTGSGSSSGSGSGSGSPVGGGMMQTLKGSLLNPVTIVLLILAGGAFFYEG